MDSRFNSQIENPDWSGKYIGILIMQYYSNITLPINESIQQANFKACCGKRLCLFWWWLFSVVQLLFLVINLTEDGKLGVEFAILSVAFWSLLICGNLLCNWWKKFRQILEVSLSTKCQVYLITINCSGVSIFGGISTTGESISQCPKKNCFYTQFLFNFNSTFHPIANQFLFNFNSIFYLKLTVIHMDLVLIIHRSNTDSGADIGTCGVWG